MAKLGSVLSLAVLVQRAPGSFGCAYIYIYICIHTYSHDICTYVNVYMCLYVRVYVSCTHMWAHSCFTLQILVQSLLCICMCLCICSRTMPCHARHTIPYHAIPYNTIPYHTIPYHTIPYHTIPYHTIPYHTIPYHTICPFTHVFCAFVPLTLIICQSLGSLEPVCMMPRWR